MFNDEFGMLNIYLYEYYGLLSIWLCIMSCLIADLQIDCLMIMLCCLVSCWALAHGCYVVQVMAWEKWTSPEMESFGAECT